MPAVMVIASEIKLSEIFGQQGIFIKWQFGNKCKLAICKWRTKYIQSCRYFWVRKCVKPRADGGGENAERHNKSQTFFTHRYLQ